MDGPLKTPILSYAWGIFSQPFQGGDSLSFGRFVGTTQFGFFCFRPLPTQNEDKGSKNKPAEKYELYGRIGVSKNLGCCTELDRKGRPKKLVTSWCCKVHLGLEKLWILLLMMAVWLPTEVISSTVNTTPGKLLFSGQPSLPGKMKPFRRISYWTWGIFHCHVTLPECIWNSQSQLLISSNSSPVTQKILRRCPPGWGAMPSKCLLWQVIKI